MSLSTSFDWLCFLPKCFCVLATWTQAIKDIQGSVSFSRLCTRRSGPLTILTQGENPFDCLVLSLGLSSSCDYPFFVNASLFLASLLQVAFSRPGHSIIQRQVDLPRCQVRSVWLSFLSLDVSFPSGYPSYLNAFCVLSFAHKYFSSSRLLVLSAVQSFHDNWIFDDFRRIRSIIQRPVDLQRFHVRIRLIVFFCLLLFLPLVICFLPLLLCFKHCKKHCRIRIVKGSVSFGHSINRRGLVVFCLSSACGNISSDSFWPSLHRAQYNFGSCWIVRVVVLEFFVMPALEPKCSKEYGEAFKPSSKKPLYYCPHFEDTCEAVICHDCYSIAICEVDDTLKMRRSRRH